SAIRLSSLQLDRSPASGGDVVELTLMAEQQREILGLIAGMRQPNRIRRISYQRGSSAVQGLERPSDLAEEDDENDQ
ncbi:MAG: hypothetical protein LC647_15825, partial [Beggiatoa sp.]|nr:hypothetical protein [Beggiatoa sp.]